jgi:hypothetical protein
MDIVLRRVGQVEIHHKRKLVDIQAASGDIGRNENPNRAFLEFRQRLGALLLAFVAVNRGGTNAVLLQLLGKTAGAVLGSAEHQDLLQISRFDQVCQQIALAFMVDRINYLGDVLGSGIATCNFNQHRVGEQLVGQFLDFAGEGGGKQQILPLHWQQRDDALDIREKAHVQHAVGLIQHQNFHPGQVDGFLLDVVKQPPRGSHQDFHPPFQRGNLLFNVDSAEYHRGFQRQVFAISLHAFFYLRGQFTGWRENQGSYGVLGW